VPDHIHLYIEANPFDSPTNIVKILKGVTNLRMLNKFPQGTIDQIGDDIRRMEDIGVDHIIFDYMFAPIGSNVAEMIDMSKELSKFAR
jgi:Transposase IS200 like